VLVELVTTILQTLYFLFPPMVANASPVLLKGGHPLDHGRFYRDGNRLFGDGKTYEGFIVGFAAGSSVAIIEATLSSFPVESTITGSFMAVGALLGDLFGAFVKRRLGMQRGAPAPLLDQLDFILGAYLFGIVINFVLTGQASVFGKMLDPALQLRIVETSLYLIPALHIATNAGAYMLGLKDRPW
jgi:CDP-2,3-bis-(O-geranylgeranyl)-sn-glycerol synthase